MRTRLRLPFYERDALAVARELPGKLIVRRVAGERERVCRIVEVEAYTGADDQASHARRGPTPRAKIMFGRAGLAYVYLVYGMHECLNVVVEREGFPAAVLVRGAEPVAGLEGAFLDGPGKLTRALAIDRGLNGLDLVRSRELYLADDGSAPPVVATSPRIGVDYAGDVWAAKPWRFYVPGNPCVSRVPRRRARATDEPPPGAVRGA